MKWRILGPVEVTDGRTLVIPRPQRRAVLAYLLLHANEVVTVDQLVTAVWGGLSPPSARTQVQASVSQLRRSLGDALRSHPGGYRIAVADGDLDAAVFAERIAQARIKAATDPAGAADQLRSALALWRGPALGGAAGAFVASVAADLTEQRLSAYEELAQLELALGRHVAVAGELRPLVAAHPERERLAALLNRAQAGNGPRGTVPALLPAGIPAFAGREEQLRSLDALLDPPPSTVVVATIEGTAGVGKTTLAVHWAHHVAARFPDGQLYVNLRGFGPRDGAVDPEAAIRGFLAALHIPVQRVPADPSALVDLYRSVLAGRRVLILLDNARDAEQVRPLLPGAPGCAVVVTSRSRLLGLVAVDGARAVTLDLLSADEARAMLVGRIGADRVSAERAAVDDVIASCARLPLALAVVAARAATQPGFPLAVLADDLRGSLDAFAGDDPVIDIRAVFSWSYRTLGSEAARLFRLLGLHPGPDVTVPAAASLAGLPAAAVRPALADLTSAHLLSEHRPGRYVLHDLLRGYAAELADATEGESEREATLRRLLDHHLHTAYAAARLLDPHRNPMVLDDPRPGVTIEEPADHATALAWFEAELHVLLAIVELSADLGCDPHTWRLVWSITEFLDRRGHWPEQVTVHHRALVAAHRSATPADRVQVHSGLARAYLRLGRFADAQDQYRQALALCVEQDDPVGQARIHLDLATVFGRQDQHPAALEEARRSLCLYEEAGHPVGEARALNLVGWYHAQLGEYAQTLAYCERALARQRELGHRHGEAATWDSLGYAHHHLGQHDQAVACYQRALELLRDLGERYYQADTLTHLGETHHTAGDLPCAYAAWQEAVEILDELGHPDADRVRARLPAKPSDGTPVAIHTLGSFEVLVDGEPVSWPSHKARDVIKVLIARRGRPVSRGALIELLWPEAKPDRLANRLSVALSTARSVLDPHRRFPPFHLVIADGDTVRLDTRRLRIDVENFLTDAAAGLTLYRSRDPAAAERLARAQSLYAGDFLESDVDADWAAVLRAETGIVTVQVAHALADLAEQRCDHDAAVRHLLPVLAHDPYDERAHLAVIRILYRAGRHGEARRRYREYAGRMSELDVVAAPYPT